MFHIPSEPSFVIFYPESQGSVTWPRRTDCLGLAFVTHSGIYCLYMPRSSAPAGSPVAPRKAKVFMNNRSQAVRLPKEFQFQTQEVFIRKVGDDVVLSPRPADWSTYLTDAPVASVQERKS